MKNKTSVKKTWGDRWLESFNKINKVVELTEKKVPFSNTRGFDCLTIVGRCGYCEEYDPDKKKRCDECPLFKKKVCASYRYKNRSAIFLQYVGEMQKGIDDPSKVDWKLALCLITMMRDVIEKDRPY